MRKTRVAFAVFFLWAPTVWAEGPVPGITPSPLAGRPTTMAVALNPSADAPTLTVPADTEAAVTMLSGIHSRISHVNDSIEAELLKPVYVNGQLALPLGSLLDGHITRIRPAGRMHHPAELSFRFDRITLPDGESEPITAVLSRIDRGPGSSFRLDPEGFLKGGRGLSWRGITGGLVAAGTFATIKAALVASPAVATVVPAAGAGLLAYAVFAPRGNDVHVPQQTPCLIRLIHPLTVRMQW